MHIHVVYADSKCICIIMTLEPEANLNLCNNLERNFFFQMVAKLDTLYDWTSKHQTFYLSSDIIYQTFREEVSVFMHHSLYFSLPTHTHTCLSRSNQSFSMIGDSCTSDWHETFTHPISYVSSHADHCALCVKLCACPQVEPPVPQGTMCHSNDAVQEITKLNKCLYTKPVGTKMKNLANEWFPTYKFQYLTHY